MAVARRVASSFVARASSWQSCANTPSSLHAPQRLTGASHFQPRAVRPAFVPARWHSAPSSQSKVYDFNDIQKLSSSPSTDRVLIDVREPSEVQEGRIPTAINIPIKSQPDALFLPAHEFEDRFGFSKPSADQEVVFYCKAGVRSSAAAQLAQQVGYKNVSEYRGSWMDWVKQGGSGLRKIADSLYLLVTRQSAYELTSDRACASRLDPFARRRHLCIETSQDRSSIAVVRHQMHHGDHGLLSHCNDHVFPGSSCQGSGIAAQLLGRLTGSSLDGVECWRNLSREQCVQLRLCEPCLERHLFVSIDVIMRLLMGSNAEDEDFLQTRA
nr:thiosulfate sulfurtransferase rdl2, mitochondrial [Quercus suber]